MRIDLDTVSAEDKMHAPAAQRNQSAILDVLRLHLPNSGTVLELASGSGEHACLFAKTLAPRKWLPTDRAEAAVKSIAAWRAEQVSPRPLLPRYLDCLDAEWPVADITDLTAIVAVNLLHIAPWRVCEALFDQAGKLLRADGVIITYGPYRRGSDFMSDGNLQFDSALRRRDPQLGLRDIGDVVAQAAVSGWQLAAEISMPANNLTLVWRR
jgi:SAM-dependent methyltransferase